MRHSRSLAPTLALLALVPAAAAGGGSLEARVLGEGGKPVPGAVVYAVPRTGLPPAPARLPEVIIDQIDKEFVPYVTAVRVGTPIRFPNHDQIRHHVYSFSPARTFEIPLYKGIPADPIVFDRPGVVALGCNIHDWMSAYVLVLETPHFALTDADGVATLAHLPPGELAVEVWHPTLAGDPGATRRTAAADSAAEPLAFEIRQKRLWRAQRAAAHRDRYR